MSKILLDYVFPISVIEPTPAASTAFLKQACIVVNPKAGQEANVGNIYECASMTAVAVRTDNTNAQQLFNAGMSKVYVLLATHLGLDEYLTPELGEFFTLLISDDFEDADITRVAASLVKEDLTFTAVETGPLGNNISIEYLDTGTAGAEVVTVTGTLSDKKISVSMESTVSTATQIKAALDASTAAAALIATTISGTAGDAQTAFAEDQLENGAGLTVGEFDGVVGLSTQDTAIAATEAARSNRCAFFTLAGNGAKSLFYAFGSLLANRTNWRNQQYIEMPVDDEIDELGDAESLFDDKVSFVLTDDEFGSRLALFAAGGKAIVAPYILKNLRVNLQSEALTWISGNQPQYNLKEAALLETRLQEDVINEFIELDWITEGTVEISLVEDNFVANGEINVAEPKALWRVFSEMQQTL
mgnify:CR=1 FL=1